jgi:hypothetical protein
MGKVGEKACPHLDCGVGIGFVKSPCSNNKLALTIQLQGNRIPGIVRFRSQSGSICQIDQIV